MKAHVFMTCGQSKSCFQSKNITKEVTYVNEPPAFSHDSVLDSVQSEALYFLLDNHGRLANLTHEGYCLLKYFRVSPRRRDDFHQRTIIRRIGLTWEKKDTVVINENFCIPLHRILTVINVFL